MAQVQLDNYSGHEETSQDSLTELEETSQDSLTEVDESRPPDPSLILSMETRATAPECLPPARDQSRATDPSLNISPPRAPECLSPAQDNEQPSLFLSPQSSGISQSMI